MDLRAATPVAWARFASGGAWKAAPHLLLLNRILLAAAAGEKWASRVIVQMPPRHGKSEFLSGYFPAWYLGMYPDRKVILASYADTFAANWGQRNRDLLETYGPSVFGVRVRQDSRAKDTWLLQRRRGAMFTAGVGGSLTGKGANMAIIDDPVKNDEQALSPTYREKAKEWYRATFRTRLESAEAPIIVIQTRWHTDDLAGWLQEEYPDDWLVISLPAVAETDEQIYLPDDPTRPAWERKAGEPLWPAKYDREALDKIFAELGGPDAYWVQALYQQHPTPLGGGILKPEQFRRFSLVDGGYLLDTPAGPELLSSASLAKFCTMDLATSIKTMADFTVLGLFAVSGPNLLLLDLLRGHWEGPDLPRVAARAWEVWRPAYIGVESVGFQVSTVQDMRRGDPHARPKARPPLPIRALLPQGDKVSRALTLAAVLGGGNFYVPDHAPWLPALEAEMAQFPKGKHDDQVDVLSYGALERVGFGDAFAKAE